VSLYIYIYIYAPWKEKCVTSHAPTTVGGSDRGGDNDSDIEMLPVSQPAGKLKEFIKKDMQAG
jgi:hypothetical protein